MCVGGKIILDSASLSISDDDDDVILMSKFFHSPSIIYSYNQFVVVVVVVVMGVCVNRPISTDTQINVSEKYLDNATVENEM
jgi:hypothetical protein